MNRTLLRSLLGFAFFALFTPSLASAEETLRIVLQGHDPVAYFTDGKPVKGDPKFSYDWDGSRYHFASANHREMFASDPERYAPQFGGYCTGSMARGVMNEGVPEGWTIRDGKLYVFGAPKWKEVAEKDPAYLPSRLKDASKNWNDKKQRAS